MSPWDVPLRCHAREAGFIRGTPQRHGSFPWVRRPLANAGVQVRVALLDVRQTGLGKQQAAGETLTGTACYRQSIDANPGATRHSFDFGELSAFVRKAAGLSAPVLARETNEEAA